MKCTDLLMQDHKVILRSLYVLEHMAARVEEHERVEMADVEALLRFFRAFADDYHQAKEESALFPELHTSCRQSAVLRHMLFEHDQERSLVFALEEALYTRKADEFTHFANLFVTLLRNHIRKEDDILFDMVEQALSPEQDRKVTAELEKFQIKPDCLAELRRLEQKYLRKAARTA